MAQIPCVCPDSLSLTLQISVTRHFCLTIVSFLVLSHLCYRSFLPLTLPLSRPSCLLRLSPSSSGLGKEVSSVPPYRPRPRSFAVKAGSCSSPGHLIAAERTSVRPVIVCISEGKSLPDYSIRPVLHLLRHLAAWFVVEPASFLLLKL